MRLVIPLPPKAKERPRVTRSHAYMPPAYVAWRREFVGHAATQFSEPVHGPFAIRIDIYTKSGMMRPDLDNVVGACLDALQDAEAIENDRLCRSLSAAIHKSKDPRIEIDLAALPAA